MLVISVVVVAVVAAGLTFVPGFKSGVNDLATDVKRILATGTIGGVGLDRSGDSGFKCPAGVSPTGCALRQGVYNARQAPAIDTMSQGAGDKDDLKNSDYGKRFGDTG